ncbi:hypothetical protein FACS189425_00010 [Clostridia bacterium]|nr:hypothetical protein FACS189425_00010 [Clostridia bacterium]
MSAAFDNKIVKGVIFGVLIYLYIFVTVVIYNNMYSAAHKNLATTPEFATSEIYDKISDDTVIEQSFIARENNFSGVAVKFNTFGTPVDSEVTLGIRQDGYQQDFIEWTTTAFKIKNNEYHYFDFAPLNNSKDVKYIFSLRYKGVDQQKLVAPMYSANEKEYLDGELIVDGKKIPGVLAFEQLYTKPFASKTFTQGIFLYIISILLLLFIIWKYQDNLVRIFFPAAMILGVLFMFTTPMFRGQDETLHFYRAYEISLGHSISDFSNNVGGRLMPASLQEIALPSVTEIKYEDTAKALSQKLEPEKVRFINFPNSALYSPVVYYPQAFGIWLARTLGLGPMYMAYFGRFFNLLVWATLMMLALQILYFGKRMVFLLSLMPMSLFTVSTLSSDPITNALSFLYISYVLYLTFGKEKRISPIQIAFLLLLCVGISLSKIVYMPLCLICFIIPFHKLGGKRRYFKVMCSIIAISLIVNLSWLATAMKFLVNNVMPGVNASMQINSMITHPFTFLGVIFATLSQYLNFYVQSFFGGSLGWFDIPVHTWIILLYTLALAFIAVADNKYGVHFGKRRKAIMIAVACAISLLIFASIYVQYNRVGAVIIEGIQGRYFMPICLLFFYLFNNKIIKLEIKERAFNFYLACSVVLLQLPVLITILMHHI